MATTLHMPHRALQARPTGARRGRDFVTLPLALLAALLTLPWLLATWNLPPEDVDPKSFR